MAAACLVFLAPGCRGKGETARKASPLPPGADMVLSDGVHFVEVAGGATTWDIHSKRATYSTPEGLLNFFDVTAAYLEDGRETYNMTGREGNYDSKKKIITLKGDVLGKNFEGYTLKTDSLQYNMDTRIAETTDRVEIRHEGLEIDGVGLIADFKAKTFRILDSARLWAVPSKLKGGELP